MNAAFDDNVVRLIESEVAKIKAEYRDVIAEESVDQAARESIALLANSKVPQFVPLFVSRFTRERLRQLVMDSAAS
jgi:hypothetical protein